VKTPLLSMIEASINNALRLDPEAAAVLAPLSGKRVGVEVAAVPRVAVDVCFDADRVLLEPAGAHACDVSVSGSPAALLSLLREGEGLPAGSGVSVNGDVGLLAVLGQALRRLRPDWEEPIARVLGDEIGHPVARGLAHLATGARRAVRSLEADVVEYLREESGALVGSERLRAFADDVDTVRDAVERLEKRVDRLERRR